MNIPGKILVVSGHIYQTMTGETEQYGFLLSVFFALESLAHCCCDCMTRLRCRYDALGLGEKTTSFETFLLL